MDYFFDIINQYDADIKTNGFRVLDNCCFGVTVALDEKWHEVNGGTSTLREWMTATPPYRRATETGAIVAASDNGAVRDALNHNYIEVDGTDPQIGDIVVCMIDALGPGYEIYGLAFYDGEKYLTAKQEGIVELDGHLKDSMFMYFRKSN